MDSQIIDLFSTPFPDIVVVVGYTWPIKYWHDGISCYLNYKLIL